jgi:hypothetical protein
MHSPAQRKAQVIQARRQATALLAKTPSAQVLHLSEEAKLPESFQPHWQAFIRIDEPTGEVWRTRHDCPGRDTWITAVLTSRRFPLRATLFVLPVAINLEITRPDWLLELYEHLHPFDLVLRLEDGDVVAFSDDEDGLRRLTVPQSALPEVTKSC